MLRTRFSLAFALIPVLSFACAEGAPLDADPQAPLQATSTTQPALTASSVCTALEPAIRKCGGKITHADCLDEMDHYKEEVLEGVSSCAKRACSSMGTCLDDAIGKTFGVTGSSSSDAGARADTSTTVAACQPVLSGFSPTAYKPPRRQVGACSLTQASDLEDCFVNGNQTKCQLIQSDPAYQACQACAISQDTDPQWGAIVVTSNGQAAPNSAGCFGLSLGEGTSTTGCGAAMHAFEECTDAACTSCPLSMPQPTPNEIADYDNCRSSAASGVCASRMGNLGACTFDAGGPPVACQSTFAALVGAFCGP